MSNIKAMALGGDVKRISHLGGTGKQTGRFNVSLASLEFPLCGHQERKHAGHTGKTHFSYATSHDLFLSQ